MDPSKEHLEDFANHPWTASTFNDPSLTRVHISSRGEPQPQPRSAHTLFSSTFATDSTLRAVQAFARKDNGYLAPDATSSRTLAGTSGPNELLVFFSLGTGLNGPAAIVHGGVIMTLLDYCMACCASLATGRGQVLTAAFENAFKAKLEAPCVVLVRSWVEEVKVGKGRRKLTMKATMEGRPAEGKGTEEGNTVYATATAIILNPMVEKADESPAKL